MEINYKHNLIKYYFYGCLSKKATTVNKENIELLTHSERIYVVANQLAALGDRVV